MERSLTKMFLPAQWTTDLLRRTHRFHGSDEVQSFLVDFLLQETEPLVVENEADGWWTNKSKD